MDWVYTDSVKEHFMHPKNILMDEADYPYDGKGETGSVKCGDQMVVYIQVDEEQQIITDCKWQTYGCASAIASTSMLSEMVKGMPIKEAYKLTPKDITAKLGGLPDNKIHCSVLGDKALRMAINDYYAKSGQADKVEHEEAKVVCQCMEVTDHEIEEAVLEGVRNYYELQEMTKIGSACGECKDEANAVLERYVKLHFSDK